jgi:hypothetical protein
MEIAFGVERVGLDDVGAGFQVPPMDASNNVRLCQVEKIVISFNSEG